MTNQEIQITAKIDTEKEEILDKGIVLNVCSNCDQIISLEDAIKPSDCPDNAYCSKECAVAGEL